MSFKIEDARYEWEGMIAYTLRHKSIPDAYIIRDQFAREDDMEQAAWWEEKIHEWEVDADQRREELEQDRAELHEAEVERHFAPSEGFN